MANGQPRPAFYIAVLLVVLGLVGLAIYRYSGGLPGSDGGKFTQEELKQMKGGAEAPDTGAIPGRLAYRARRRHLHLPAHWPWRAAFDHADQGRNVTRRQRIGVATE